MSRLLLLIVVASACRSERVVAVSSSLHFELLDGSSTTGTPRLVFPPRWVDGLPVTRPVKLVNVGSSTLTVQFTTLAPPFAASLPERVPPGSTLLEVSYTPTDAGLAQQALEVSAPDVETARLELSALGQSIPTCVPSASCRSARFDTDGGVCTEVMAADGTACEASTLCLVDTHCEAGRCVGSPRPCDDGNACTVDVCHAQTGCENLPAPPCPADDVCQVGTCDPATGCGTAPALDGTRCGPLQTCGAAQVCIDGACVKSQLPEGYVCDEASPCSDEGRCRAQQCVHQQLPWRLEPRWSFDSLATANPDAGVGAQQYHDFVLEPSGAMTLGGFFNSPGLLRANTTPRLAPLGTARRCILWNGRLVCADYPSQPNGRVTALDLASGVAQWTFDVHVSRPDFVARTDVIFLARLVVQSSDRLAALYEAYPQGSLAAGNGVTFCRSYFLFILDARGALVSGQALTDPLLEPCNHPHPYGAAADLVGNLAIAFSPTITPQAPLLPQAPTLLMSFTHDGLFRWKRLIPGMTGGELAIARGLLYPENSPVVFAAATGEVAFTLPSVAGRVVVSNARHIPAPVDQGTTLTAYEAGGPTPRWSHDVPAGFHFAGDQLRLGTWATSKGPRTVAFTWLEDDARQVTRLHAVDVQSGVTAFSCEATVPPRTWPQLFEVVDGHLGVMGGAVDRDGGPACEKCDPPRAGSSAAFEVLDVPGVTAAQEPWPGTFGGPGHDHQEKRTGPP